MPGHDDARPDDDNLQAELEYGVDPDPPMKRAEEWARFIAFLHVIGVVYILVTAFSLAVSLLGLASIVVGIYFVVASYIDERVGIAAGLGGVALIVAGAGILWLLRRLDLDA